jgi:hypothetical protein
LFVDEAAAEKKARRQSHKRVSLMRINPIRIPDGRRVMASRNIAINLTGWRWTIPLTVALMAACAVTPVQLKCDTTRPSVNLGDYKQQLIRYHDGGQYERELEHVDAEATAYVIERSQQLANTALVLDIDETALSNWEQLVANDFAYFPNAPCDMLPKGPCGAMAWDAMAAAEAIAPTVSLYRAARAHHVATFFITGRYEGEREATERNLRAAGYSEWAGLLMRPNGTATTSVADFKMRERWRIAQTYTIVANVGDQPSDLAGGFAEKEFLLPNPFYRIP